MSVSDPCRAYYEFHVGDWRGELTFAITDWRQFWATRMSLVDRWRALAMALLVKLLGALKMETRVEIGDRVVHHTRLAKLGFTLFSGREVFQLRDDGRSAGITLEQRFGPLRRTTRANGSVVVAEDARAATYDLPWFGGRMTQATHVVDAGLALTQTSPWSRGEVLLARVSSRV